MNLPDMIRVRKTFSTQAVTDIASEVAPQFEKLDLRNRARRGASVAVGCSSRGIANYNTIVKATVDCLSRAGLEPFLFPAMGSHGAATAQGQKSVLEGYGITESFIGAPIRSSLETVQVGETDDQVPVFVDRIASEADHIVLVNRIKPHTDFEHEFESGLLKMMAIGLGKEHGATIYHRAIMTYGYPRVLSSVARQVLDTGKIICGVGIVENGYAQTARIRVLGADEIITEEKVLLEEARLLSPALPFEDVDVLIIDEMGKDISGTGFDTKVVGRILMPLISREPESPRVKRIVVCDLTSKSQGNADGVGMADFVTKTLVDKIDFDALHVNALAGGEPERAKIPMTLDNTEKAVQSAIESVGLIPVNELKVIRIKNTLKLDVIEVSSAYRDEIEGRLDLETLSEAQPMRFDDNGNLPPFTDQE
jgi:hypothetical protein